MSRHKLVKSLDYDEELEDYDGGAGDDFEEELTPEDRESLCKGSLEVRNALGPEVPVTDKEIEDSLYYYYYDVEKTVNYILGQKTKVKAQSTPKASNKSFGLTAACPTINPALHHIIGLLGIGSAQTKIRLPKFLQKVPPDTMEEGKPRSKLAALAAARRKKENARGEDGKLQETPSSAALLDKLGTKTEQAPKSNRLSSKTREKKAEDLKSVEYPVQKAFPIRSRPEPIIEKPTHVSRPEPQSITSTPITESTQQPESMPVARPSAFAKTILARSNSSKALQKSHSSYIRSFFVHAGPETKNDPFAGPSPDDVVIKAQTSKGAKNAKPAQAKAEQREESNAVTLTQGISDVSISDKAKARSKNLDVVSEYEKSKSKNAASFVVIGHVDAGKSTLMGRLLHDLKVVDQRTMDRFQREASKIGKSSFAYAWVMDEDTEERARGVTIDIATNRFSTSTTDFTILDAPGHRDFIPNMIAGAARADFALLVIDADTGNFESGLKGQTKEHVLLVRSTGVQRIVVAINKLDATKWSHERFTEIQQQLLAFLTGTGFNAKSIIFIACSGLTGDNIVNASTNSAASWYTGPTLLAALEPPSKYVRALDKPLRMTVEDVFRFGVQSPLSIIGRIDQGTLQVGDAILALPTSAQATLTIKSILVDDAPADWAVAGQTPTLHLTDIPDPKTSPVRAGDVVCHPTNPIACVTSFSLKLLAFEHVMPMQIEVLKGRLHAPGKISRLVAVLDKSTGAVIAGSSSSSSGGGDNSQGGGAGSTSTKKKAKKVRLVKPGEVARVVVEVDEAVPLETGGRVVLRAGGETVGAGLVE